MNNYEWLRRQIFAISFAGGFCLALYGISLKASEHPANNSAAPKTITIDVNHPQQSINYQEVDQFMAAQDVNAVKFAATDNNKLILSDKPIVVAKAKPVPVIAPKPYMPTTLADLGLRLNRQIMIVKIPGVQVAINNVSKLPVIPPMIVIPRATQIAQAGTFTQTMTAAQPAILSLVLWLITALSTVTVLSLLLASRQRRQTTSSALYSGKIGAPTDMIGEGEIFDFSTDAMQNKIMQMNTTSLNMLWHLGRFSKDSAVDTYFYMAFYIPPQQQYAGSLKRKKTRTASTTS